ncbi:Imidazole glycerol phosphate synthase amidotransferase subunit [hydrothermal vent metagenome]|uniref:Imidazole glycerol phosphate synthase amidotransferase subunit n=1 Tax=hydrothermal vent metagenome TaxID=652676 RepID=A0A3B0RTH8_9ZZZZ
MSVMIADTGCANLASVRFALARLGVVASISAEPEILAKAQRLILPGVGSARAAMQALQAKGLAEMLIEYQRPLLGICLGLQLLFRQSEEANTACLGRLPGQIEALPNTDGPVPHMGWNTLDIEQQDPILHGIEQSSYVYFVHSFAAKPDKNTLASTQYGMRFAAIIRKDNLYACQFHPERSGKTGARILQNFMKVNQ